jgi:hypothetical protein
MAGQFDAAALAVWQDRLAAHPAELPDPKLRDELKRVTVAKLQSRLTLGNGAALRVMTADRIVLTKWPAPVWAVPDILPAGLCIPAGKPKLARRRTSGTGRARSIRHGVATFAP